MKDLPFKAVAVDMDGTFVNSENTYDHERFDKVLTRLKKHGVHFIVASGRPFGRLKQDFDGFLDRIDIIADNGGILVRDNQIIATNTFGKDTSKKLLNFIKKNYPTADLIACGLENSYIFTGASDKFRHFMKFYYPKTIEVNSVDDIPDSEIFDKMTIWDPTDPHKIETTYNANADEKIHATSSGFNCTDIVPLGINKATSLEYFLNYFNLTPDELIAFGDGMNDLEMMKLAGYSYAMANGEANLKKVAKYEAPTNNDSGVLVVLEKYLDDLEN